MTTFPSACAICGNTVGGAAAAHAVRDKVVCEACCHLVVACQPQHVLPYAQADVRRRRWWWPMLAAALAVAVVLVSLLVVAQRAAMNRARAEQMRALAAEQRARAAAAAIRAGVAETQPAE